MSDVETYMCKAKYNNSVKIKVGDRKKIRNVEKLFTFTRYIKTLEETPSWS